MLRTAVAIRHVAFEDLGCFAPAIEQAGYRVHYYDVGLHDLWTLEPVKTELLIVLGGPVGAYQEETFPFLAEEIDLLAERLAAGRPTLGICLGAQLLARALGARVAPGPAVEIGFAPLTLTAEGRNSPLEAFADGLVLHWHGDGFELPEGAVRLASTPACENQAFSKGPNALAVQFHPEAGGPGFERWLVGHAAELAQHRVDVPSLRAAHERHGPELRVRADRCVSTWLSRLER